MKAGALDRRITLMVPGVGEDDYGSPVETWAPGPTVWASVRQTGGREFLALDAVQSERKVVFVMRWIPGITEAWRVVHEGRTHDVREARELGRREGLELHTTLRGQD